MKRQICSLIVLYIIILCSCEKQEEIISSDPGLFLEFSTDTVSFDTIFTIKQSITQRLRVFNRNEDALKITSILLAKGSASEFSIIVNGSEGDAFTDIVINGKDSLLILVETFINGMDEDLPFLITDEILFTTNRNTQAVNLLAYGQDAIRFGNEILDCNTLWTSERPYLLMDTLLVDSLCQLQIEAGARIFFEPGTILFVGGSLLVNGTSDSPVIFTNSRKDFQDVPGQWGGIFLLEGSKDNLVNFAEIRNARIGLRVGTPDNDTVPDLILQNSKIENMSDSGLLCFNSDVRVSNTLIQNCAVFTVGNLAGGNYYYEHCTFASFGFDFFRNEASTVFSDNIIFPDNSVLVNDLIVELKHSLIWGSLSEEITLSQSSGINELNFEQNLLRTQQTIPGSGNILNMDPLFLNPEEGNFRLEQQSPAVNVLSEATLPEDLDGLPRDSLPDLGAYEWRP